MHEPNLASLSKYCKCQDQFPLDMVTVIHIMKMPSKSSPYIRVQCKHDISVRHLDSYCLNTGYL